MLETSTTTEHIEQQFDEISEKIPGLPENWKEIAKQGPSSKEYRNVIEKAMFNDWDEIVQNIFEMYYTRSINYTRSCSTENFANLELAIDEKLLENQTEQK